MNTFHLAFKVNDLASTRKFYIEILNCKEGRSTETWLDFYFFGHQLSAHVNKTMSAPDYCGHVDKIKVPIPHFGCILDQSTFTIVQERLEQAKIQFIVKPQMRYSGQVGQQLTMFVLDPSNNPIEFKCFIDESQIFSVS